MKRIIALFIFAVVFASAVVLDLVPNRQRVLRAAAPNAKIKEGEECSNASLEGSYGGYGIGTVVPDGTPQRSLVRSSYDGRGNWSNSFTINDNGTVRRGTASGTYKVNPDCTGTEFGAQGQPTFDFVLVDRGNEFYSVRTDPASRVLTFRAKRQFPRSHDNDED